MEDTRAETMLKALRAASLNTRKRRKKRRRKRKKMRSFRKFAVSTSSLRSTSLNENLRSSAPWGKDYDVW